MKIKSLVKLGLLVFLLFIFSGCVAYKPSTFQTEVNKINMPLNEKQKLLNDVLVEKYGSYINGYQIVNGCVNFTYSVAWMHQEFSNCYRINNDKIIREDYSQCYYYKNKDKCRYAAINFDTDVKQYSKFLDSIDIANEYNNKLISHRNNYESNKEQYDIFVKNYNKEKNKLNKQLISYKNKIIDKSKILPKELLDKFKFKNLELISNKNECYREFKESNSFKNCFKVRGGIDNLNIINDNGFDFKVDNWSFNKNIYEITNPIIYEINSDIKFNFLPKDFYTENEDIKVHVSSDYYIYFTLTNKTNDFIEIKNISLYWDKNINSLSIEKNLPPQAVSKVGEMNILQIKNQAPYKTKYKVIKNLNESTNFGVAIQYEISNKKKNLYKTKTFTVKDLFNSYKN